MQIIHLNANSFSMFPRVAMVQNDTGRELKMVLDDMTLSGSETGAVAIHRSDGSYYTIPATRVVGDNAFTADMSQALTQPRQTECQLKITASDDTVISTYTFVIEVQPSTDGLSEEQLGINPQDLIDAAAQLTLGDNDVKLALLQIAEKVVYTDEHGQDYYDALENALYPPIRATSVSLNKASLLFDSPNETKTLIATVSPSNVEDDTVYWGSSDKTVAVVSEGIVTSVGNGNAIITATCGAKHASASVNVSSASLVSISAVYTQSGTVYDNDNLNDLKEDLVVTAHWSDNTDSIVPSVGYTLSGTLKAGTSTITATYGEQTTTFTVSVTSFYTRQLAIQRNTGTLTPSGGAYRIASIAGRVAAISPVPNNNYVYTVTNASVYEINVVPITSITKNYTQVPETAVDGYWYQSDPSINIAWGSSFSRSTPYVWIALRRIDGVEFTDEELANGAESVFTVDTEPVYGYVEVGSPSIVNNVLYPADSSGGYIRSKREFSPTGSWKIRMKMRVNNEGAVRNVAMTADINGNRIRSFQTQILPSSQYGLQWLFYLSSNSTSWNVASSKGFTNLTSGTDYYQELEFTGTQYTYRQSTDGQTWTETEWPVSSTTKIYGQGFLCIGIPQGTTAPVTNGQIYLEELKVWQGGSLWWQPIR